MRSGAPALDGESPDRHVPAEYLLASVDKLQHQQWALREYLIEAGFVRPQRLLALEHRSRFRAAQRRHPETYESTLLDVLRLTGLPESVVRYTGHRDAGSLAATCSGLAGGIQEAEASVRQATSGVLCVCGGFDGRSLLRSAGAYHCATGTWEALPDMNQGRAGAAAAAMAGSVYVCGGSSEDAVLRSAECFDASSGSWLVLPAMAHQRAGHVAVALEGAVCVCGGQAGNEFLCSAERYCPKVQEWQALPDMACCRARAAVGIMGGALYVCGGQASPTEFLSSVERYEPSAAGDTRWVLAPEMAEPRAGAAAAVLQDRELVVCGGHDGRRAVTTAELLRLGSRSWASMPGLPCARSEALAVVLDCAVHVFGGSAHQGEEISGHELLNGGLRYEPAGLGGLSGTWRAWQPMFRPLVGAAAAMLPGPPLK